MTSIRFPADSTNQHSSADQTSPPNVPDGHGGKHNRYIGNVVYGGLDGIVTTFAVVCGVVGAGLSANVILIMGCANLVADGFSMATGAFLSARSEREYYEREWQRELQQINYKPDQERQILYDDYEAQGYTAAEAQLLVMTQSHNRRAWARIMMIEELGLLTDERSPFIGALVTFGAFVVAGALPLLAYVIQLFTPLSATIAFGLSLVLSGRALFLLGAAKVLVTARSAWKSGFEMMLVGSLAAGVAYLVGMGLKHVAA